jgi:hypothetical protein
MLVYTIRSTGSVIPVLQMSPMTGSFHTRVKAKGFATLMKILLEKKQFAQPTHKSPHFLQEFWNETDYLSTQGSLSMYFFMLTHLTAVSLHLLTAFESVLYPGKFLMSASY